MNFTEQEVVYRAKYLWLIIIRLAYLIKAEELIYQQRIAGN